MVWYDMVWCGMVYCYMLTCCFPLSVLAAGKEICRHSEGEKNKGECRGVESGTISVLRVGQ